MGVVKADLKRMLTKIAGAIGYKHDPKMRQELLSAFEEDIISIMDKHGYVAEAEDHEVGMALGQLQAIHTAAGELEEKLGTEEKDIPAWIQAHITSAYEYLKQANDNFHELEENLSAVTPTMLGGMGPAVLPNAGAEGSGDVPAGSGDAKKKKKKKILNLEEFLIEQEQLKAFKPTQGDEEELGDADYEHGSAVDPDTEMKLSAEAKRKVRHVIPLQLYIKT